MNTLELFTLALAPGYRDLLGLLFWVAIAVVVIGAIVALIKWLGWQIPQPVWIIGTALISILLIVLLFHLFGLLAP